MKFGAIAILTLGGALVAVAPAQAERPGRRPAYAPPPASIDARPVHVAPSLPARPPQVWGANGYRFDAPAGAVPIAPSPYGY